MAEKKKSIKKALSTKAFRAGGYSSAAAVIIILLAILVNMLVSGISSAYTELDTTESGLYSLSTQTKDIVSSLEEDVTIYYVASEENQVSYVKKLIEKFVSCGKNLHTENVDPDVNPGFAAEYTDETVANGDLIVVCGDKAQVVHYTDMTVYEAGSYESYQYYMQYYGEQTGVFWNGEVEILKAVDYVTSEREYNVYFLDIGGEGNFSHLEKLLANENMKCQGITEETTAIPDDASCVVLSGMSRDLSDSEYDMLISYLDKGGKFFISVDAAQEQTPMLDALLEKYGIAFTDAILEDGDRHLEEKTDLYPVYTQQAVAAPFTSAHHIYFPDAAGVVITESEKITTEPIITTSESAYLSTDEANSLDFGRFNLGVAANDTLTGAQLIVYGSEAFTQQQYIEDTTLSNSDLFINSIAYLCDKDSAITIHAKAITSDSSLDFGKTPTFVLVLALAIIPALACIVISFIIRYRRKNR